jgi:hypothetical protein
MAPGWRNQARERRPNMSVRVSVIAPARTTTHLSSLWCMWGPRSRPGTAY